MRFKTFRNEAKADVHYQQEKLKVFLISNQRFPLDSCFTIRSCQKTFLCHLVQYAFREGISLHSFCNSPSYRSQKISFSCPTKKSLKTVRILEFCKISCRESIAFEKSLVQHFSVEEVRSFKVRFIANPKIRSLLRQQHITLCK